MIRDRNNETSNTGSDPVVSVEYRAMATESTPPALDAIVLREAEAATRESTGLRAFTASWFRPLTFVATLALSLALLLELTSEQYAADPAASPEAGHRGAASFESEPSVQPSPVTEDLLQGGDLPASKNQSAPAPDTSTSADFSKMVEAGARRMQESDKVTDAAIQNIQQTKSAGETRADDAEAFSAFAITSDVAPRPCNAQQISESLKWWQCIAELEELGRHDEATAELALLKQAYPEFEAPETLPAQ